MEAFWQYTNMLGQCLKWRRRGKEAITLTTLAFDQNSSGWFRTCSCKTAPEGPTLTSGAASWPTYNLQRAKRCLISTQDLQIGMSTVRLVPCFGSLRIDWTLVSFFQNAKDSPYLPQAVQDPSNQDTSSRPTNMCRAVQSHLGLVQNLRRIQYMASPLQHQT